MSKPELDIGKMSITELKAFAYDLAVQLEVTNNNLRVIRQEIVNRESSITKNSKSKEDENNEQEQVNKYS